MIASEYKQEKRLKRSSAISNFGVQESLDRTEKVGDGNRLEVRTHLEEEVATPLQQSCLENPMDKAAWWATVLGSKRV